MMLLWWLAFADGLTEAAIGKWVHESGILLEIRRDGFLTIEPFEGDLSVGRHAVLEKTREIHVVFRDRECLWRITDLNAASLEIDPREKQTFGRSGAIRFRRMLEGRGRLHIENSPRSALEGTEYQIAHAVRIRNRGTGPLLLRLDAGARSLWPGENLDLPVELKGPPSAPGKGDAKVVAFWWKDGSGEARREEVRCEMTVTANPATLSLDPGKPVKTDPAHHWQWMSLSLESRGTSYLLVSKPGSMTWSSWKSDRSGPAELRVAGTYKERGVQGWWLAPKSAGEFALRVHGQKTEQSMGLAAGRPVPMKWERPAGGRSQDHVEGSELEFPAGDRSCTREDLYGQIHPLPHERCAIAVTFQATQGRVYAFHLQTRAHSEGRRPDLWMWSEERYREFSDCARRSQPRELSRTDCWEARSSGTPPLWECPKSGTYRILVHAPYAERETLKLRLSEFPAIFRGQWAFPAD